MLGWLIRNVGPRPSVHDIVDVGTTDPEGPSDAPLVFTIDRLRVC